MTTFNSMTRRLVRGAQGVFQGQGSGALSKAEFCSDCGALIARHLQSDHMRFHTALLEAQESNVDTDEHMYKKLNKQITSLIARIEFNERQVTQKSTEMNEALVRIREEYPY